MAFELRLISSARTSPFLSNTCVVVLEPSTEFVRSFLVTSSPVPLSLPLPTPLRFRLFGASQWYLSSASTPVPRFLPPRFLGVPLSSRLDRPPRASSPSLSSERLGGGVGSVSEIEGTPGAAGGPGPAVGR